MNAEDECEDLGEGLGLHEEDGEGGEEKEGEEDVGPEAAGHEDSGASERARSREHQGGEAADAKVADDLGDLARKIAAPVRRL